ncbi:FAD-binding oxidoreductase [uncultured Microbulbifer sp.]|uniref:FAD-binding oxidoreductase n=1 Tax=uncultured Microbulbifer sp. TaxID=348147 RepID=UPI00260549D7|nr:FAD-binding oxidoreductase [uncultured Microbulbifer sp.]
MKYLPLLFLFYVKSLFAVEIEDFYSDGCSIFPDGTPNQSDLWLDCCRVHDYAYWKGGSYAQRQEADRNLEVCVAKTGESEVALLMLVGVRVGGTPFLPTPFRWGYGWPYLRGYKALTEEDLEAIERAQESLPRMP